MRVWLFMPIIDFLSKLSLSAGLSARQNLSSDRVSWMGVQCHHVYLRWCAATPCCMACGDLGWVRSVWCLPLGSDPLGQTQSCPL